MNLRRFTSWDTCLGLLTLCLLAYAVARIPNFASSFNISQALAGVSEKALIVLPMMLLMITREIDLSVASILALSSVVLGVLLRAGVAMPLAVPVVLAVGGLAGAANGLLVTRLGLSSLVVTLGTMALFRGLGYVLLGSDSVNELPDFFTDFGIGNIPYTPIPWTLAPFLLIAPVFGVALHAMAVGRRIYAVGGNPQTAQYSGINAQALKLRLFIVSGLMCAIAGIVFTARLSNARANNAVGYELDVITMSLLGGINVFGGKGRLAGVIWAVILMATLRDVLGLEQVGGDAQGIAVGLLLILSLLLNTAFEKRLASIRARSARPAEI